MIDMRIDQYHITNDARNYVVTYSHEKDGKMIEGAARFYNSLPQALQAIAKDMMIRGDERVTNVEQYVQRARMADGALAHCAWKYGLELEKQSQNI